MTRPGPDFAPATRRLSSQGVKALRLAESVHRRPVRGREIADAWPEANGEQLEERRSWRMRRVLGPAIADGFVKVRNDGGKLFFAHRDSSEGGIPRFTSDQARMQEAVRSAAVRYDSAVPLELIREEVQANPELTPDGVAPISNHLSNLLRDGGAVLVPGPLRSAGGRNYYSFSGGPEDVRPEVLVIADLRTLIVQELWEAAGWIPFTTRALRLFATDREPDRFADDPESAWTNHLQLLVRSGDVVPVGARSRRAVRWAIAREWRTLLPDQQAALLAEPLLDPAFDARARRSGGSLDPTFVTSVSRNDQLRKLVLVTMRELASRESRSDQAEIISTRPVSAKQVRALVGAGGRESYAGVQTSEVVRGLREASRARAGTKNPAVFAVGVVGRDTYYDVAANPEGKAYVAFLLLSREFEAFRGGDPIGRLVHALTLSSGGVLPIGTYIEQARVVRMLASLERWRERIDAVQSEARLLRVEQHRLHEWLEWIGRAEARVTPWRASTGPSSEVQPEDEVERLDVAEAFHELREFVDLSLQSPRHLQGRLQSIRGAGALVEPPSDEVPKAAAGRPVEKYFERISYVGYTVRRWGGPRFGALVGLAVHVAGDLRHPAPFAETLMWDSLETHAGAAAVLGILDDPASREVLVAYLRRVMEGGVEGRSPDLLASVETAVLGLAPLPVGGRAQRITEEERKVLGQLIEWTEDAVLQETARVALRAWDESWSAEALMEI